jgi:DNA-binding LytR/AlgR family response regulator
MLKIVLCDDKQEVINKYAQLIYQCCDKYHINIELSCFFSGESLIFHLLDNPNMADIIYLDILMDKLDGMVTAKKLRDLECKAQIIFLTSCEDFVYEAFDVNAVHYLLKDETTKEKFEHVFLRAVELAAHKEEEVFCCEFDGKTSVIPLAQIAYFEIYKRVVSVYYGKNMITKFYASMDLLKKQLNRKGFVRVHRSFLVHLSYIVKFQNQSILLKTDAVIPIGTTFSQPLKQMFSEYISKSNRYNHPPEYDEEGSL